MKNSKSFLEKHFTKIAVPLSIVCAIAWVIVYDFTFGNSVIAESLNWKDEAIYKATTDIAVAGQETVDDLLANGGTMGNPDELDDYILIKQQELDRRLREYYEAQISGLVSENELKTMKKQIDNIMNNMEAEYRRMIDKDVLKK